ncbi:ATP synthase subunit b [Marinobacterium nitratireducens]|uniref:ATP synthase subunit b n=1 Tax=Marinobacterium nitratireducens TaxID=518897 RepID=A0A917ZEL5_9GAMM|nr:F0F1 ATP synthase subunit delta [Marinobacterium nitratireducens]GGO81606.1 ATP synthase subunit b [Marinobacterium nitratireducens]
MELSGSTFVLEIINFLVLIWLLQRFFYKPLQAVIARRRAGIDQQLADATDMRAQAQELQSQYENRLSHWEAERQRAREALQQEIERERTRQHEGLRAELDKERRKAEVSQQHQLLERQQHLERLALEQGSRFATRLLELCAGPELETRLLEMLLNALPGLPTEQLQSLREHAAEHPEAIEITSAFELPPGDRSRLQQRIDGLLATKAEYRYLKDPELLAGLRLSIGPWVFRASVRDELKGFADLVQSNGNTRLPCAQALQPAQTEQDHG